MSYMIHVIINNHEPVMHPGVFQKYYRLILLIVGTEGVNNPRLKL